MKIFIVDKWKIIQYCAIIFLISIIFIFASNMPLDFIETIAGGKLTPIYNIKTEEPKISLTFDCAWGAEDMDSILNTLKTENVKVTFFVLGEWAAKYPEVIKRMAAEGHDVANHSDTHPHIASLTYDKIKEEIKNANSKIESISGKGNNLFRTPYGEYNDNVIKAADEEKFYTIQWDVDSLDWKNPGKDAIINRVVEKCKNGSIVLLHSGTQDTANVLSDMLKRLKEKGFSFAPISEFIYKDNYTIDHTGMQIKN